MVAFAVLALPACKSQPNGGNGSGSGTTVDNNSGGDGGNDDRFVESKVREMWVAPYTETCQGEAEMECLLVSFSEKRPAQGEWEYQYTPIQGFEYEKGYLYRLKVQVSKLKPEHVMMDASDREYLLLEVLQKDGA